MIILLTIIAWLLFGLFATTTYGKITNYILKRKWKIKDDAQIEREMQIAHIEQNGETFDNFTYFDWFIEVLLWPLTLWYATKGMMKLYKRNPKP